MPGSLVTRGVLSRGKCGFFCLPKSFGGLPAGRSIGSSLTPPNQWYGWERGPQPASTPFARREGLNRAATANFSQLRSGWVGMPCSVAERQRILASYEVAGSKRSRLKIRPGGTTGTSTRLAAPMRSASSPPIGANRRNQILRAAYLRRRRATIAMPRPVSPRSRVAGSGTAVVKCGRVRRCGARTQRPSHQHERIRGGTPSAGRHHCSPRTVRAGTAIATADIRVPSPLHPSPSKRPIPKKVVPTPWSAVAETTPLFFGGAGAAPEV